MIVGCYTMDLYCDDPRHDATYQREHHPLNSCLFQATGSTLGACARKARRFGWVINLARGTCRCPAHAKPGHRSSGDPTHHDRAPMKPDHG